MKLKLSSAIHIMALAVPFFFSSCKKDSSSNITPTPLQSYINSDTSLTLFNTALQRANDAALFSSTDSVTVLAPTNTALISAGLSSYVINTLPVTTLDSLIRYHYIAASANLVTGSYNSFTSLLGPAVYGFTDGTNNYFNGSMAVKQVLSGGNATLYELSAPLKIPAATITQLLAADTSLTYFAEALNHTGLNLVPTSGWNTVLTPDNNSFIAAGYSSIASIDSADVTALTNILQYHILAAQYFSNYFIGQSAITSAEGHSINISYSNNVLQFTGNSNTTAASVTQANEIAGTNIIVHKINGVLLP